MTVLKAGESYDSVPRLSEIQNMNAKDLLKKYKLVVYSRKDIDKINAGLAMIQSVLDKNRKLITGE